MTVGTASLQDAQQRVVLDCSRCARHRLKFEFHAQQPNGSEFSVEMLLGVKLDWPEGLAVRAMQVRVFAKFGVCRLRGLLCKFGGHDFATQLDACQSWKLGLVLRRGMLLANAA